ncbi:MAG: PilZ domain-containing protein [Gammaproteobacteria bacterium]|nr:PilZ domain-containing protein [Gammaproteobacteria bacterium]MDH5629151.1 PilZ domain-containing protein [Gammaproteobacteria bacterium]
MSTRSNRKDERLPVRIDVYVTGEGFQKFIAPTLNFSEKGLFIESKILAAMKKNSLIEVQAAHMASDAPILKARIAWSNQYGAGIEYLNQENNQD